MMNNKRWNDSGFTLIELLVSSAIVLIAIIGLFVGIQFTENQLFKNYRTRKAILLASARLEYNNFYLQKYGGFLASDDSMPVYGDNFTLQKTSNGNNVYISFNTEITVEDYSVNLNFYDRRRLVVTGTWNDPGRDGKLRQVRLMEDYYAAKQD